MALTKTPEQVMAEQAFAAGQAAGRQQVGLEVHRFLAASEDLVAGLAERLASEEAAYLLLPKVLVETPNQAQGRNRRWQEVLRIKAQLKAAEEEVQVIRHLLQALPEEAYFVGATR